MILKKKKKKKYALRLTPMWFMYCVLINEVFINFNKKKNFIYIYIYIFYRVQRAQYNEFVESGSKN